MGAFYFISTQHETRVLFFGWNSKDTSIYQETQKSVLNQKVYDKVRADISGKLGNNAEHLIALINI